jgi:hypothetical protein
MAFVSIRQYRSSDAAEVGRRAADESSGFVPIARDTDGISAWYLVDGGDGTASTITVCDSEAAANESVEKARAWVADNASDLIEGAPTVTGGEVIART